ncbi:ParB/RepB/Spo0J family partition protein [Clostridium sp. Marseille-P299]|uniref:ParB/RepB/Spo0J family partition protein n=1 Tax=Clostridium sp. Marseille-P299 TaxID=1805477 RepID=UPI000833E91C|nr:ParB/RepB/Spo0J family partition protein [Clostridium sp. Marseille-P299]
MAIKKGLGKGLDSLITDKFDNQRETVNKSSEENVSRETLININKIEPNKSQPRKAFEEDALQELADSIKQHGIIQPLIVQKKGKLYEIIAGERRWRAARLAGLKEVPVLVKDYSDQEVFEIALIENIQREDLNAIEEALAYQRLIEEYKLKQDEVAERVAKSRVAVTNSMRLLKLDKRVQQMLIDDMISGGHARALLSIKDNDEQYNIANLVFDQKLSVRETEKLVKKITDPKPEKVVAATTEDSFVYRELEEKMKLIFGSKVEINRKSNNKGKIEIEYYSNEDLERIIDLINTIG